MVTLAGSRGSPFLYLSIEPFSFHLSNLHGLGQSMLEDSQFDCQRIKKQTKIWH